MEQEVITNEINKMQNTNLKPQGWKNTVTSEKRGQTFIHGLHFAMHPTILWRATFTAP
jgi:hypothetical protein